MCGDMRQSVIFEVFLVVEDFFKGGCGKGGGSGDGSGVSGGGRKSVVYGEWFKEDDQEMGEDAVGSG